LRLGRIAFTKKQRVAFEIRKPPDRRVGLDDLRDRTPTLQVARVSHPTQLGQEPRRFDETLRNASAYSEIEPAGCERECARSNRPPLDRYEPRRGPGLRSLRPPPQSFARQRTGRSVVETNV